MEEVLSKKELPDLIAGLRKHVMGLVSADVLDPMQTEGGEANDETTESKQWCVVTANNVLDREPTTTTPPVTYVRCTHVRVL